MMLTDEQGMRLIDGLRRSTQSADIVMICDWVLSLVARRAATEAERKARRNEYQKLLMQRLRREARERRESA